MRPLAAGSPLIGMGCMRLSTERSRDDGRSIAVLHAALDAGVNFLDTADVYCWDSSEMGHNERLISRGLATWQGDRSRILVATKGDSFGRKARGSKTDAHDIWLRPARRADGPWASNASLFTSCTRLIPGRHWRRAYGRSPH